MKKIFSLLAVCLFTVVLNAQDRIVTKFLGIPIDGTKAEMIQKLKAKGFRSCALKSDVLEGEFNGRDVNVYIVTNNNKVYRIMVADKKSVGESDVKIRFNTLCRQFESNGRYRAASPNQSLSGEEEIGFGIRLHNKRYEAVFYQKEKMFAEDMLSDIMRPVWFMISEESYGKYYIAMYYDNEYNQANGEDL